MFMPMVDLKTALLSPGDLVDEDSTLLKPQTWMSVQVDERTPILLGRVAINIKPSHLQAVDFHSLSFMGAVVLPPLQLLVPPHFSKRDRWVLETVREVYSESGMDQPLLLKRHVYVLASGERIGWKYPDPASARLEGLVKVYPQPSRKTASH